MKPTPDQSAAQPAMTAERWMPIEGYHGHYEISDLGRVRSLTRRLPGSINNREIKGQILVPGYTMLGYKQTNLSSNGKHHATLLHRVVAKAFIPNPEGKPQINHKDGDKSNNAAANLEWVTQSENICHAQRVMGLFKGDRQSGAKLSDNDVLDIRALISFGATRRDLASAYGVCRGTIDRIANRTRWIHV